MKTQIVKFAYSEQEVEFDLSRQNMMVNATEMAKIFGRDIEAFSRNESTKRFIYSALKTENSRFLGVKSRQDLITSRQKSGTWMHRILALKFAAWLDPDFEVWVYLTIDQLLQSRGPVKPESAQERARLLKELRGWQAKVLKAKERIEENNKPETTIILNAEREISDLNKKLNKLNREDTNQLNVFAAGQLVEQEPEANEEPEEDNTDQ
jgi:hypothetical protein